MRSFREWIVRREMAGTGAVWDGTTGPDFQWWGAPWSAGKIRRKKKKAKKKR